MADDPFELDTSLQIPVSGQPSRWASPLQPAPQAQPVTLQDLRPYLGRSPAQPPASAPQNTRQTQVNVSGRQPASIRYNNPGAMWPGPSSKKFGSTSYGTLADGNRIAKFDDPVSGGAAQFDLLNSKKYMGRQIGDLIGEWSGYTGGAGNVSAYATHVARSIGLDPSARLTPELLSSRSGIEFAKAMAKMEAGVEYPMTNDQWSKAQRLALGSSQGPQPSVAQEPPAPSTGAGGYTFQDLSQYLTQPST